MSTIAEKYAGAPMTIETYANMYVDLVEIKVRQDEEIKFQKQRWADWLEENEQLEEQIKQLKICVESLEEELANYKKFEYQIENHEYEYFNYGTQWRRGDDVCYRVAGGGLSNGNAYAEVERVNDIWYYCEYGKHPSRSVIGTKIVWSNEYYQGNPPYEYRNFDILP